MKRLKGYSFKLGNQELVLREPFSNTQPSFDCIFFSTNVDGQLCKVLELETEASQLKFQRERYLFAHAETSCNCSAASRS